MSVHASFCPLDCPDRCSLDVTVEEGRVVSIDGSRTNPLTEGFICSKVRRFPERVYGPDRILRPMVRTGPKGEGRFQPVSWPEAVALVARRLGEIRERWGGEAILPYHYGGSNGLITHGTLDTRFFTALGASRLDRAVCAAPTGAVAKAMTGKMPGVAFPDYEAAGLIVLWGANPWHSNIHLVPHLKRAREAGGRVVLIDPRATAPGAYVDEWLAVRPGTDVALALSLVRWLAHAGKIDHAFLAAHTSGHPRVLEAAEAWTLDRAAAVTGLAARDISRLAEDYAATDPAVIRIGWGPERNRNGGSAVAAILALPALAGKFGRRGGGFTMSNSGAFRIDDEARGGGPEGPTRLVNMNLLGRVLLGEIAPPPVMALFVYDCNPVVTVPDQNRIVQGLRREDLFTVVFDAVLTDTARYADVVLPATTFLEHDELSHSYGSYTVHYAPGVIPPVGEGRPNPAVFRDLAHAAGIDGGFFGGGEAALRARALASVRVPLAAGADLARLERDRIIPLDFPGGAPVQFVSVFPFTADRRMRLDPAELGPNLYAYREQAADPGFPLALISPATDRTINSMLGELKKDEAELHIHPDDARARGIVDAGGVRVFNALGEVRCRARLSERIRPGVVSLPKGAWRRSFRSGTSATALVADDLSEIGGGACFNDARVEVQALDASAHPGAGS
jgi:anaerobic selenocysteine-containing dehydrogenase